MSDLTLTDQELTELQKSPLDPETVDFDASTVKKFKSMWVFGHWRELSEVDIKNFVDHPERDKIALLIGAAYQQIDDTEETEKYIALARKWGCDDVLIAKVLLSGVTNTLAKVHALNSNNDLSQNRFNESLTMLLGESESKQIRQARSITELSNLGLLPQVSTLLGDEYSTLNEATRPTDLKSKASMLKSEIDLINHNISLSHKKRQLYSVDAVNDGPSNFSERLAKISPSQLGQDVWVLSQVGFKRNGYFVEFGATDGILLSNTYLLEKEFDWQGICAEPNPVFFEKLKKNRRCLVSDACIGSKTGDTVEFVLAEEFGGIADFSLKGKHGEKVLPYISDNKTISLKTTSLLDFLVAMKAPKNIDYLSIDTEGSEFSIIENFPFEQWEIKMITIEHNFEEQREKISQLLSMHGYKRKPVQWDDWYYK